jgi:hypothetical protein
MLSQSVINGKVATAIANRPKVVSKERITKKFFKVAFFNSDIDSGRYLDIKNVVN